ncbi:hypothetical protein ACP70R_030599 [Stipagrostis hirtigluma subsp. patula]
MSLRPRTRELKARTSTASWSRSSRSRQGSSAGAGAGADAGEEGPNLWLRTLPDMNHVPEEYGDAPDEHGVAPAIYQALERHLRYAVRTAASRDAKLAVMRQVLGPPPDGRVNIRYQRMLDYRENVTANYLPLHPRLFTMDPSAFFVPSFLQAIRSNTEDAFKSIMTEPAPGLYVFSMLQPAFCHMLTEEAHHFERWIRVTKRKMMKVTVGDGDIYGAILSDFGLETMLNQLMNDFISPIAKVLYPELGASPLDSHHSFVSEYPEGQGQGFQVNDSTITLNACIRDEFTGGEMYFHGVRCVRHVNSETNNEGKELYAPKRLDKLCCFAVATGMAPFPHLLDARLLCKCGVEGLTCQEDDRIPDELY